LFVNLQKSPQFNKQNHRFFEEYLPLFLVKISGENRGQRARVKGQFWEVKNQKNGLKNLNHLNNLNPFN